MCRLKNMRCFWKGKQVQFLNFYEHIELFAFVLTELGIPKIWQQQNKQLCQRWCPLHQTGKSLFPK